MLDLRLATGQSFRGKQLVKVHCMFHDDQHPSMLVDWDHLWCPVCRKHIRQKEGLALLLGYWNGDPKTSTIAARSIHHRMQEFDNENVPSYDGGTPVVVEKLDTFAPMSFHRYMLACQKDRMREELMEKRGFGEQTIRDFVLGHTGTHFALPVYSGLGGQRGELLSIRFRVDEKYSSDSKYSGVHGHNQTRVYALWTLPKSIETLFVCEGEFDAIAVKQAGGVSATVTNGASSLDQLPNLLSTVGVVVDRWVIATDLDEAGDRAAFALRNLLNGTSRRAMWPDKYKDIGALLADGAKLSDVSYVS